MRSRLRQLTPIISLVLGINLEAMAQMPSAPSPSKGAEIYAATLTDYLADKDAVKARRGYLKALDQDPLLVPPRLKLAQLAIAERNWKEAGIRLQEVLEIGAGTEQGNGIRKELQTLRSLEEYGSPGVYSALDPEVKPPTVVSKTNPRYTGGGLRAHAEGDFSIWLEVGGNGVPANLKVIEGLGHGLDEKALQAVAKWRFKPAIKDDHPVKCAAVVTVTFETH